MKKSKTIKVIFLLGFTLNILSCRNEKEQHPLLSRLRDNKLNIFNLKESGYSYNGKTIYTVNMPYPGMYIGFLESNFLMLDKQKIYFLTIFDNCKIDYVNNNYKIGPDKSADLKNYNQCDIHLIPFVDFAMGVNDTLTFFDQYWVKLDNKFYDKRLDDTLYKFRRHWGGNKSAEQTIIIASKNTGILGVYDTSLVTKKIEYPVGYTLKHNNIAIDSIKTQKPTIELKTIKEFKPY